MERNANVTNRLVLIWTLACMIVMCACGSQAGTPQTSNAAAVESGITGQETEEPVQESIPEAAFETREIEYFPGKAAIDETVLYDEDGISLTATGLTYDDSWAYLTLKCRNDSAVDIRIEKGRLFAVNHYMFEPIPLNFKVAAGSEATESLVIPGREMALYGIKDIGHIDGDLDIFDSDYHRIARVLFAVDTSLAGTEGDIGYAGALKDESLMAGIGCKAELYQEGLIGQCGSLEAVTSAKRTTEDGDVYEVEWLNPTDQTIHLSCRDMAVNGWIVYENLDDTEILPGGRLVTSFNIDHMLNIHDYMGLLPTIDSVGIHAYTCIDEDDTDFTIPPYDNGPVFIGITGERQTPDTHSLTKVYDNDGLVVHYAGFTKYKGPEWTSDTLGHDIYAFLMPVVYNGTEELTVQINGVKINGEPCSEYVSVIEHPLPGCAYANLCLLQVDDIEKLGLTRMEDIASFECTVSLIKYSAEHTQNMVYDSKAVKITNP